MKFPKSQKPELISSDDKTRGLIQGVNLRAEDKTGALGGHAVLEATNGVTVCVIPVVMEKGDAEGPMDKDVLIQARKCAPKKSVIAELKAHKHRTQTLDRTIRARVANKEIRDGIFPDVSRLFITARPKVIFAVDAENLYRMQKAFGCGALKVEVVDGVSLIKVSPIEADIQGVGLIAPMRIDQ